jgi:hypothetical protein
MRSRITTALVISLGLFGFYGMPRTAAQGGTTDTGGADAERTVTLIASAVQPGATGEAQVQFASTGTASDQGLEVHCGNLAANQSYGVRIDGAVYATVTADASGSAGVVFQNQGAGPDSGGSEAGDSSSEPQDSSGTGEGTTDGGNDLQLALPDGLAPVTKLKLVEVVNSSGQVVLNGTFSGTAGQSLVATAHISLTPSGAAQGSGSVSIKFEAKGRSKKQSAVIQASGLSPQAYNVSINGLAAGTLKIDGSGSGQVSFIQKKRKNTLPRGIASVLDITQVQILDSSQRPILSGRLGI